MKAEFHIKDVFNITGRGTVLSGKILKGVVSIGDYIVIEKKRYLIRGVEMARTSNESKKYDVGLLVSNITKEEATWYKEYICDVVDIAELRNNKIDNILGEDSI